MITLADIFKKTVVELTDEEKLHLRSNENQLTNEQKEKFADVLKEDSGSGDDESKGGEKDADNTNS